MLSVAKSGPIPAVSHASISPLPFKKNTKNLTLSQKTVNTSLSTDRFRIQDALSSKKSSPKPISRPLAMSIRQVHIQTDQKGLKRAEIVHLSRISSDKGKVWVLPHVMVGKNRAFTTGVRKAAGPFSERQNGGQGIMSPQSHRHMRFYHV